ncbi:MAG: response regulator [Desulfitobacterium sp.]
MQSDGVDKGTQCTIRLPIPATLENETKQKTDDGSLFDRSLRILVIDDIPDIAEILSSFLELLGYKNITSSNGAEGISRARDYKPDVIICDIGLPDMSGYEVARCIRSEIDLGNVRLIALSGYAYEDDLIKARTAGFDKHLAKPVDLNILQQVLREII